MTRTDKKSNYYKVIKAKNTKFVAVKTVCIVEIQGHGCERTAFHNCCFFIQSPEGRRS